MRLRHAFALTLILALGGCASFDPAKIRTVAISPGAAATWRGLPIESGQIIMSEHPGATSLFLSLTAQRFSPYLHVGIIVIEEGRPYVYESMGIILPLPWRAPNENVGGGVRRISLETFLLRGGIVAIYSPDPAIDRGALSDFARRRLLEKTPFDGHYDASDAAKFYCVEFVARALEAAGAAPREAVPATRNPSVRVALNWLGIDTPGFLLAGELVTEDRRVVLISRRFTEHEVARYFELKRELHRRFTDDQRIGNVVYWSHTHLRLRPRVDRYYESGIANDVAVAAFADEMFGATDARAPARVADSF